MIRRATARLSSTETTTVKPKFLKNCPEMPGIRPTGRNTATIAMVVATTARPISSAASIDGLIGGLAHAHVADDVLDLDDGIIDEHAGDQAERQQAEHVQREADQVRGTRRSGSPTAEWRWPKSSSRANRAGRGRRRRRRAARLRSSRRSPIDTAAWYSRPLVNSTVNLTLGLSLASTSISAIAAS